MSEGLRLINNTMLTNAIASEMLEMGSLVSDVTVVDMFDADGGIAIPIIGDVPVPSIRGVEDNRRCLLSFNKYINNDCLQLERTLEESLQLVSAIVADDSDCRLYGAIWVHRQNTNIRVNILHPVIAYCLLNGLYKVPLDTVGTLYIYEWNQRMNEPIHTEQDVIVKHAQLWNNAIEVLSTSYQPEVSHRNTTNMNNLVENFRRGQDLRNLSINFSASGNSPRKVLTPVQLFTKDMLFPYYGCLISEKSSEDASYASRDLTLMGSPNINHDRHIITRWGGTCTGNRANTVYASLTTLNNANTGSPHHTDVIVGSNTDIKTFVKVSQDYACNLIDKLLAPEEVADTEEPVSAEEHYDE